MSDGENIPDYDFDRGWEAGCMACWDATDDRRVESGGNDGS